jgi:hypothetical protein
VTPWDLASACHVIQRTCKPHFSSELTPYYLAEVARHIIQRVLNHLF